MLAKLAMTITGVGTVTIWTNKQVILQNWSQATDEINEVKNTQVDKSTF